MARLRKWSLVTVVVTPLLAILLLGVAVGTAVARDELTPLLSIPVGDDGAVLSLMRGIGRQQYFPVGCDGLVNEYYSKGLMKSRRCMYENPGDWCLFFLDVPDGKRVVFDRYTRFVLKLADSTEVVSDMILVVDDPDEYRYWDSRSATLIFANGMCPYVRVWSGAYPLTVRFPEWSCLTDKGDEHERRFRSKPASLNVEQVGHERGE